MNFITNLNIARRPQSQKKNNPQLPAANPTPPLLNPPVSNNTVLKFNNQPVINLKPLDGTGIFGRQKMLHMNSKIMEKIAYVKRKEIETQTEEIFFKMYKFIKKIFTYFILLLFIFPFFYIIYIIYFSSIFIFIYL
jgi:hypothetical protein